VLQAKGFHHCFFFLGGVRAVELPSEFDSAGLNVGWQLRHWCPSEEVQHVLCLLVYVGFVGAVGDSTGHHVVQQCVELVDDFGLRCGR
jgi:hypothetical protein